MQQSRTLSAQAGSIGSSWPPAAPATGGGRASRRTSFLGQRVADALFLSTAVLLIGLSATWVTARFSPSSTPPAATVVQRYLTSLGDQHPTAGTALSAAVTLRETRGPCAGNACLGTAARQELAALIGTVPARFAQEETSGHSVTVRVWLSDGSPHETVWQTHGSQITSIAIGPRLYDAASPMP